MATTRPRASTRSLKPRDSAPSFPCRTWRASRGSLGVRSSKSPQERSMSAQDTIKQSVTSHPFVLYMKVSPQVPMCSSSATATQLLKMCGADELFTVDVLKDPDIREGIKQYANWPTIPQLYVNGEFFVGCDIIRERYQSGRLPKLIPAAQTRSAAPAAPPSCA